MKLTHNEKMVIVMFILTSYLLLPMLLTCTIAHDSDIDDVMDHVTALTSLV